MMITPAMTVQISLGVKVQHNIIAPIRNGKLLVFVCFCYFGCFLLPFPLPIPEDTGTVICPASLFCSFSTVIPTRGRNPLLTFLGETPCFCFSTCGIHFIIHAGLATFPYNLVPKVSLLSPPG